MIISNAKERLTMNIVENREMLEQVNEIFCLGVPITNDAEVKQK